MKHVPCDIVLVIDVSSSMATPALPPSDAKPAKEEHGLSILDLVKHAARMIIETLDERERLGIVTFANRANVSQTVPRIRPFLEMLTLDLTGSATVDRHDRGEQGNLEGEDKWLGAKWRH